MKSHSFVPDYYVSKPPPPLAGSVSTSPVLLLEAEREDGLKEMGGDSGRTKRVGEGERGLRRIWYAGKIQKKERPFQKTYTHAKNQSLLLEIHVLLPRSLSL